MAHTRATLRTALIAALVAAGTGAGARVYAERTEAIAADEFPCIVVKIVSEQQARGSMAGGGPAGARLMRTATLNVHYTQKQEAGYTDAADEAARLIEVALALAPQTTAALKDIEPTGTLFDEETEGEHQLYTLTQTFSLTYITSQGDPATAF